MSLVKEEEAKRLEEERADSRNNAKQHVVGQRVLFDDKPETVYAWS